MKKKVEESEGHRLFRRYFQSGIVVIAYLVIPFMFGITVIVYLMSDVKYEFE
ncbi:MAG: hypothetical protein ACETWM_12795 [Candidatus Lokiarchaeia archaeon]